MQAEIWPGVVKRETQLLMETAPNLIKDQAQVMAMCLWASKLDSESEFGPLFNKPAGLNSSEVQICIEEEGWILGAV